MVRYTQLGWKKATLDSLQQEKIRHSKQSGSSFRASTRRGAVKPAGIAKQACIYCHGNASENSAYIFVGSGEEVDEDDQNEDQTVVKLLTHEVEEDNENENLEKEERNFQEVIDNSEPGPSRASK
ncbi:hypothetical protein JTB14_021534 [Gonioctena quinquepunctata]|nr:hypothetical protein JTB14_021534 [Gonioctena quinquepunctata]